MPITSQNSKRSPKPKGIQCAYAIESSDFCSIVTAIVDKEQKLLL